MLSVHQRFSVSVQFDKMEVNSLFFMLPTIKNCRKYGMILNVVISRGIFSDVHLEVNVYPFP